MHNMITSYKEMSVGIFTQYIDIVKKYTREDGAQLTQDAALAMQVETIALLSGMSVDEVELQPLPAFSALCKGCLFLRSKVETRPMKGKYIVGSFTLQPCKRVDHWTASQYIDYQAMLKADNMAGMLACMLIPRGKTYGNGYDIEEVMDAIKANLSIEDAMAVSAFFLMKYKDSIATMITSSVKDTIMMQPTWEAKMAMVRKMREVTHLLKSGDGSQV